MNLGRRLLGYFVAPSGAETEPPSPPSVALLCAPEDAAGLAASVGLALAARGCAVTAVWTGGAETATGFRAPPLPAARRLAANLAARGHDAHAAGRLATVALPPDEAEAAAAAERVIGAAGVSPTVLAIAGARGNAFDALLAGQDLVVVAPRPDADPILARLAMEGLVSNTRAVSTCVVPPAPARALAASGLTLLPSTRRALGETLRALP